MVSKATKVRLGIFLAIGFIAILLFAIAVAGNRLTQKWDTYYIMFKDYPVSGLQVGGTVNYQGIKVGQVQAVKIDPEDVSKVIITINVEPGTPIKEDTEAVLSLVGITGLKAVEIKGGTNEAKNMQPESFIKAGSTMLDDISDRALSIAEKIDVIAANIGEITNNENQESIARILSETSLLLADTRANLGGTLASLNRIAENTAGVTEDFGKNLERLTTNLTTNLDLISRTTVNTLDSLALNLNTSIEELTHESTLLVSDARTHLNRIGVHTDSLLVESSSHIVNITKSINETIDGINRMINSEEFELLVNNIGALSGQLAEADFKEMVTNLSATIQRAGSLVSTVNRTVMRNQDNIMETMENLRETSSNLNEFSRQIAEDPSSVLRGN
ncbi:MAG: MlaD family protein [Candidatus Cloacimonetes bacterium]|nr:MlaD family protein [Candidatus Cloacimonadota bacterium]MDD2542840.1 MlaD family protein [Candidatus Cloacimonadota bacterium]MDD2683867.1 MlaD family protein [Candidatus Cloacimonadota bacterium]MDD3096120.1 MlaD family protein [Candidatus Cloacimonadota bacterium]MDD4033813.1 MlaD family protein [Candidatus Cloacimonadota bacterium]